MADKKKLIVGVLIVGAFVFINWGTVSSWFGGGSDSPSRLSSMSHEALVDYAHGWGDAAARIADEIEQGNITTSQAEVQYFKDLRLQVRDEAFHDILTKMEESQLTEGASREEKQRWKEVRSNEWRRWAEGAYEVE